MSLLAVVLALGSSIIWGTADFAGGSLTKRLPTFAVTVVSQAAGFVAILVAIAIRGEIGWRSFSIGLLAGAGGGVGLAAFYRALSLGTMSVVSPVAACGALVPFALSLLRGERPSKLALVGAAVALGGAVLASLDERRGDSPERVRAIGLAVVAAGALGLFVYFLGLGSQEGDPLSTLTGARVASLTLLVTVAGLRHSTLRLPRSAVLAVVAVGLADIVANGFFAYATQHGLLALVSVLGSLYPVVTVLLAHLLLGERLTRPQQAGVAAALAGVCAIAAG